MTRYLLDTHLVIWWLQGSKKLGAASRSLIERNECSVSVLSVWEIVNKLNAGQLKLPDGSVESQITGYNLRLLPLTANHIETGLALNDMQGDPFDRMLVGVAKAEGLTLATRDAQILQRAAKHLRGRLVEM
jgi:PIN domain nuclease of toxin-antitoxin system